jgi:hypothetical protein
MQYAIVKDNKVINIIVADETFAEIYALEHKAKHILDNNLEKAAHLNGDLFENHFRPPMPIITYEADGEITFDKKTWKWVLPNPKPDITSDVPST